jgi:hypothetical protein
MEVIRKIENYSLVKKDRMFYIDNGIDDVSEYFDEIDAIDFIECGTLQFLDRCEKLFK